MLKKDNNKSGIKTPLMNAAEKGFTAEVEALIQNGTEIEAQDSLDLTALCYAAKSGQIEVIKLVLQYGADPNPKFYELEYKGKTLSTILDLVSGEQGGYIKYFLKMAIACRYNNFSDINDLDMLMYNDTPQLNDFINWKISIKPQNINHDSEVFKVHLQDLSNLKKCVEHIMLYENDLNLQKLHNTLNDTLNNYSDLTEKFENLSIEDTRSPDQFAINLAGKINEAPVDALTHD